MITGKRTCACGPLEITCAQNQHSWQPALKFHQLRIGARFEHNGSRLRKISPLRAVREKDEKQKLIPRSAEVLMLDEQGQPLGQKLPDTLATERVEAELDRLVKECLAASRQLQPPLTETQRQQLAQATHSAVQDLLTRLAIDG